MRIGIVADKYKDPNFHILEKTAKILSNLGVDVVYPDQREEHRYVGTGSASNILGMVSILLFQ